MQRLLRWIRSLLQIAQPPETKGKRPMSRTLYALLVGIDAYPRPVPPLQGCVNDIRRVETLLQERANATESALNAVVLTDEQATRQAIIDQFRAHLGQAGPADQVLFYYSGHGSQAPSPPEFWKLEPDRLDETLVCWDSRLSQPASGPRHWDLADKELAQLIAEVAANEPHVTIILDCCHSGSGTRNVRAEDDTVRVRRVESDKRTRPIEEFIVTPAQAEAVTTAANTRNLAGAGGWFTLPQGRHVVLAACRSEEEAKELYLGGEQRGAFSYYLLDTLAQSTTTLTYRDLFKRVNALVRARVSLQAPQIEATQHPDLDQPFLGGAIQRQHAHFTVHHDKTRGWVMDGGLVHGLPTPEGAETTHLALFPFDASDAQLQQSRAAVGTATVTATDATESRVTLALGDGSSLDPGTVYKALITALPLPPLNVALVGDAAALEQVRTALTTARGDAPSLLVRESDAAAARLRLTASAGRYQIQRVGDAYPLGVETAGFSAESARLVVQRLEHIARWLRVVELTNSASQLADDAVTMELVRGGADAADNELIDTSKDIYLTYEERDGEWHQPPFRIRLRNNSQRRLYCMLIDATESYAVNAFLPGGGLWLDAGQEAWVGGGQAIYPEVPQPLWEAGVTEYRDTLKLIVTTKETDATLLAQDELPTVVTRSSSRTAPPAHLNTLSRLFYRTQTRALSFFPAIDEEIAEWSTTTLNVTTVRPQAATAIAAPGSRAIVGAGVAIHGHPHLQATARLTSLPQVSRDAGNPLVPPLLRDHPDHVVPLSLSNSRSGLPGLSVLELNNVADHSVVTPEEPLVVDLATPLAADEKVLPVGFDGEFFLPLGHASASAAGTTVTLERLPAPTAGGTRDLKGSIKILFQKLAAETLGWEYEYPQLAIGEIATDGTIAYVTNPGVIRERVTAAEKIVLYLHGIIGDTRAMAGSSRTDWQKWPEPIPAVGADYDLLLTFDYENLNTRIEENALALKERLVEVGLGPEHGKTLHIIAHSMGGLVARWLIEREQGNRMVQKLVMLGTPNAGSPWPTVQDYASMALGIGLNALGEATWSIGALSALVGALEEIDVTLDQMNPGSDFFKLLNVSPDPGIPYVMISGNTALVAAALAADAADGSSMIGRLWRKIMPKKLLHTLTAPVFFGEANDIAATVRSVHSVPRDREQSQIRLECVSDHITYFESADSLQKLHAALAE